MPAAYHKPSYHDPNPFLYAVSVGSVLRKVQKEHHLLPGALLLLMAVDVMRQENQIAPTTAQLCTGWLSASTVREYVRLLEKGGYLSRTAPRRRAAKHLLLTAKGVGVVSQLKRSLREQARTLCPAGHWPLRF